MSHWTVKSQHLVHLVYKNYICFDTKPVCQTTSHGPAENDSFLLTCFGKALNAKRIVNICDFSQLKKLKICYLRIAYLVIKS